MERLILKIKQSGLLKAHIAEKAGVSPAHFSMMLSGKATMSEQVRNKVNEILDSVIKVTA